MYDADGNRRSVLLPGEYELKQSRTEYKRLLLKLTACDGTLPAEEKSTPDLLIDEFVYRYMREHGSDSVSRELKQLGEWMEDGAELGGKWVTSVEAIERFSARQTPDTDAQPEPICTPKAQRKAVASAKRKLKETSGRAFYTRYDPKDFQNDEGCRVMVARAVFWAANREIKK